MEKLKLYKVTKSSTDNTFKTGDLIWLSLNGDLNNAMGRGWLTKEEWNVKGSNNFEYEVCSTHCLEISNGQECIRKIGAL